MRCIGKSQSGARCVKKATLGNYCAVHFPQKESNWETRKELRIKRRNKIGIFW